MRYAMLLSYDGSRYQGWQRQGNTSNTITEKLQTVLSRLLEEPVVVSGAGRTDAGVHALGQVAAFDLTRPLDPAALLDGLRSYLPEDIAVLDLKKAPERFHPRLSASGKIYRYEIREAPWADVFRRRYQWALMRPLDLKAMEECARILLGEHDFRAFSSDRRPAHSTVRELRSVRIDRRAGNVAITYEGSGFLYNMVRILTGTLVQAGLCETGPDQVREALLTLDRQKAGATAPAKGLTLVKVIYPDPFDLFDDPLDAQGFV